MFAKILVPLDGSETAEAILPFVQEIATHTGGGIVLMTAVQPVAVWDTTVTVTVLENEESSAVDYLKGVMAKVPGKQTCRVVRGEAAEAILEAADEESADLIAIGTHGPSGLARWLFGSTAGKVLERAKVPVLFLRPKTGEDKGAPGAVVKKILVPLDGSDLATSILGPVEEFAKTMGASLVLVHAVTPITALPGFETQAPAAVTILGELQKNAQEYLAKLVGEVKARGVEATGLVSLDEPVHAILEAADETKADLIAVATHGRGGLGRAVLGSVADGVVRRSADVPCLVLRAEEKAEA
jgi:nucleotide-binding universal stress UspA family protein